MYVPSANRSQVVVVRTRPAMLGTFAWQDGDSAQPSASKRTTGYDVDGPLRTFRPPKLAGTVAEVAASARAGTATARTKTARTSTAPENRGTRAQSARRDPRNGSFSSRRRGR